MLLNVFGDIQYLVFVDKYKIRKTQKRTVE